MAAGIYGQNAGFWDCFFYFGSADGEGEAGGAGAVVGDEEGAFGEGWGEVDVEDGFSGGGNVREVELLGEVIGPGEGV